MKYSPLFLLLLLTIISSSNIAFGQSETSLSNKEASSCFDENSLRQITSCKPDYFKPDSTTCQQRYAGKFPLTEASKSMIAEYCLELGDEIHFRDYTNYADSTIRTFVVVNKFYGYTTQKMRTRERCPDDANKVISACAEIQMVTVEIECKEANLKFYINLSTFVYAPSTPEKDKIAEKLTVGRKNKKRKVQHDLWVLLNPKTLEFANPAINQVVDTHKTGKIIEYSYSNLWNKTKYPDRFTINYMNGLSLFSDDKGIIWGRI